VSSLYQPPRHRVISNNLEMTVKVGDQVLRRGFTTGATAAAAAKAAAHVLSTQEKVAEVTLSLPNSVDVLFQVERCTWSADWAEAVVIKEAGDDPDITDGAEICARVSRNSGSDITLRNGPGVGTVTRPGLAVAVGEPSITPAPRRMIIDAVREVMPNQGLEIVISVPTGEKLAEKTLNARLGIVGGISILGTSGIVEPISTRAWEETIAVEIDVALASERARRTVVLTPGRVSEEAAMALYPELPEEAFIHMGDHVGFTLRDCADKGVDRVIIVGQFGKFSKVAMGYMDTNCNASFLDVEEIAQWARGLGADAELIQQIGEANTARHVTQIIDTAPEIAPKLYAETCRKYAAEARKVLGEKARLELVLLSYEGEILHRI